MRFEVNGDEVRALHVEGASAASIAKRLNLPLSIVHRLVLGLPARPRDAAVPPTRGKHGPVRRLTIELVAEARERVAGGESVHAVAGQLGVAHATMYSAIYGLTWTSVSTPSPLPRPRATLPARGATLTAEDVAAARRMYVAGRSLRELAVHFEVADQTIRSAIHGLSWAAVTDPPPVPIADAGGPRSRRLSSAEVREIVRLREGDGLTWQRIGHLMAVDKATAWRAYRRVSSERRAPLDS
ncbi:hypothetical protein [Streptomyces niveus]